MSALPFSNAKPPFDIGLGIRRVDRPPTWRGEPYTISYLLADREVDAAELTGLLRWSRCRKIPNPRVITPRLISWSSLFHPRFFKSAQGHCATLAPPLEFTDGSLSPGSRDLSRLWLQSLLFLAGVTLSAAIVQRRCSEGTVGSKLDRLWDAGTLANTEVAPELRTLDLHRRVLDLASRKIDGTARLLTIRRAFLDAIETIVPTSGTIELMEQTTTTRFPDARFGFVDEVRSALGSNLRAVVVYGSSVSGNRFTDIDALAIVDDPAAALGKLAGTSPAWQGKELNLGIYSPYELVAMQRLSGDNLDDYGLCIWGETEVVRKPVSELLARNLSFGVVRQCQQLGMVSRAATLTEPLAPDRRNLYEYFVKIPANIAKGTFGAVGRRLSKERIHDWLSAKVGFDTTAAQLKSANGQVVEALAASSVATGRTLAALNESLGIVHRADHRTGTNGQEGVGRNACETRND